MQTKTVKERAGEFLSDSKVKIVGLAGSAGLLVASVSADVDINGTIGPLLDQIVSLIPSIIGLVVALVPAIIIMAIVGFIVAFLDKILAMLTLK
jgi:hypothetical protein